MRNSRSHQRFFAVRTHLTVTVDISIRTGFAGTKTIYEFSADTLGNGSGWSPVGSTNDSGDVNVVEITSLAPLPGSGFNQTLTATIKNGTGAATTQFAELLVTGQPLATFSGNGCFIFYVPSANVFYLLNDAASTFSGLVAGSSASVSNSQCTLHGAGSGGTPSGSTLTVNYNLSFTAGFAGSKHVYMQAADSAGNIEAWHNEGTDNP